MISCEVVSRIGTVSEITGPDCSGRTSLAQSLVARVIESGKVAAWIDVSDTLDPASAAAAGIDLRRLLWVRCGVPKNSSPEQVREFTLPNADLIPEHQRKAFMEAAVARILGMKPRASLLLSAACFSQRR
jgi:hypothetical protein